MMFVYVCHISILAGVNLGYACSESSRFFPILSKCHLNKGNDVLYTYAIYTVYIYKY